MPTFTSGEERDIVRLANLGIFCAVLMSFPAAPAIAGPQDFCVTCTGPAETYRCRITGKDPGPEAKRIFCMVKTANQGGHKSCSVRRTPGGPCKGTVKTFNYNGPALPPALQSALRRRMELRNSGETDTAGTSEQRKPKTLAGVTIRAVKASGKGLKKGGSAVVNAAGNAGSRVGSAARKGGGAVATAAGTVGSAALKGGGAVGSAAKTAYKCVRTLFRKCRDEQESDVDSNALYTRDTPDPAEPGPLLLTPQR